MGPRAAGALVVVSRFVFHSGARVAVRLCVYVARVCCCTVAALCLLAFVRLRARGRYSKTISAAFVATVGCCRSALQKRLRRRAEHGALNAALIRGARGVEAGGRVGVVLVADYYCCRRSRCRAAAVRSVPGPGRAATRADSPGRRLNVLTNRNVSSRCMS